MNDIILRKASFEDIEKIAEIKVSGWQEAFRKIVSDEYLNNMSIDDQIKKYKEYDINLIYVVEINKEIVAFSRIYNYNKSPYDDIEIDCEIREIFVKPSLKRNGIGSILFKYIIDDFKQIGKKKMYLGCFKENLNSRKFYEKMNGIMHVCDDLVIDKSYEMVSYIFEI